MKRIRKIGKRKLVILLFISVIGVALAGMSLYISTPSGCLTCHEMRPFYDAWISSAHQDVDCHECHKAGTRFYIRDLIKHIQGVNVTEIEAEPPTSSSNQQCFTCHKSYLPNQPEEPSDISCLNCHDINHYKHIIEISGDYDCSTCHGDHTMNVKEETCKSCHSEVQ